MGEGKRDEREGKWERKSEGRNKRNEARKGLEAKGKIKERERKAAERSQSIHGTMWRSKSGLN